MNIPLTLTVNHSHQSTTLLFRSNQLSDMFDRLLEPDFSIPFKTLTFFTAIFASVSTKQTERGDEMFLTMARRHCAQAADLESMKLLRS